MSVKPRSHQSFPGLRQLFLGLRHYQSFPRLRYHQSFKV